ncbi:MAG TPA: nicotinate-nucleotide--dimethylbenzimidazole phosphoribosyltransferase [Anaeromyxobacteraceae bacterium]|nr:nicotinate-nucleotide--dimethylbenzimidazole phosphoribosyltransferase [Anaeromyxobacteraceae bacterium]
MSLLQTTLAAIRAPDADAATAAQRKLDGKTKPLGSLGRLEELASAFAGIRRTAVPELPVKAMVLMAGDHGVADEGVSAFPQAVTAQMVANFASGGAAINVISRQVGARLMVVDVGVKEKLPPLPGVRDARVMNGTRNFTKGPAMTREETVKALEVGIGVANELADAGVTLIGIGEMGIANSTPAAALTAAFTGRPVAEVTGRGTGIDDATLRHKVEVIERALRLHADATEPLDVLARLGGLEIAGLAGVVLGAAARAVPVLTDGVIATSGALAAAKLCPAAAGAILASHRSVEIGHRLQLEALGKKALFDFDLRLGEGTGAALAMGIVDASVRILREMASFDDAGVSKG